MNYDTVPRDLKIRLLKFCTELLWDYIITLG